MKSRGLAKIFAFVSFVILLSAILWGKDLPGVMGNPASFDAKEELWRTLQDGKGAMGSLLAALPTVISKHGVVAAELLAREAFQQGTIDLGQCHDLLHTTGHYAYSFHKRDLKRIARDNLLVCGNAYQHGVEAEIVVSGEDAIRELHEFCEALRVEKPYATCYHGAGHAVMYDTQDMERSLLYCERLNDVPAGKGIGDCPSGVFSEYTSASRGIDGHTGLHLPGGSYAKLPPERPLDFCQMLSPKYHSACASQVSRVLYRSYLPEDALERCVADGYSEDIQKGCLRTVSALFARKELQRNGGIDASPFVASLPEEFRKAYIRGIALEFWMLRDSGLGKDDERVCGSFGAEGDRSYCTRLLNSQ